MAHLVSSDRDLLTSAGRLLGMSERWLQYKPLKHPGTGERVAAWHWDLRGHYLDLGLRFAAPTGGVPQDRSSWDPRPPEAA